MPDGALSPFFLSWTVPSPLIPQPCKAAVPAPPLDRILFSPPPTLLSELGFRQFRPSLHRTEDSVHLLTPPPYFTYRTSFPSSRRDVTLWQCPLLPPRFCLVDQAVGLGCHLLWSSAARPPPLPGPFSYWRSMTPTHLVLKPWLCRGPLRGAPDPGEKPAIGESGCRWAQGTTSPPPEELGAVLFPRVKMDPFLVLRQGGPCPPERREERAWQQIIRGGSWGSCEPRAVALVGGG